MILNIGRFLTKRARLQPAKIGLIAGERRISFAALNERANQVANGLRARGIGQGDRVAIMLRNAPTYYELYFGLAKIGAILCAVNWRLAPPEIAYILKDAGARLLFYGEEFAAAVDGVAALPQLEARIAVGATQKDGNDPYETLLASAASSEPPITGGGDDPLLLMYTSGTTGFPKGALLTHEKMFWSSATIIYSLDHRHDDVNLLPLPLYHIGGMSFATTFVHLGSTAVLPAAWDPGQVLALVERERINHFMAVPTMLGDLLDHPAIDRTDLSTLRWLLVAAAPVPADLIRAYAERDILLQQSYGLTETAGPATFLGPERALEKAGSAGLPFFHSAARVVDPQGQDVAAGAVGEIWIRGPHVISRYWRNPEATAAAFHDGWFRSGDLGYLDEDGYLYIVDRMKDMIISGGENIYPAEVENALYAHPALREVAVIGVPDERWGETVCAVVVLRDGAAIDLEKLQAYCAARLARYKVPRRLVISDTALPRTGSGKLMKANLQEWLEEEALLPAAGSDRSPT